MFARTVQQHVGAPHARADVGEQALQITKRTQVGECGAGQPPRRHAARERGESGRAAANEEHARTVGREGTRRGRADPRGGAGDDDRLHRLKMVGAARAVKFPWRNASRLDKLSP
jgi:hypothetical protein